MSLSKFKERFEEVCWLTVNQYCFTSYIVCWNVGTVQRHISQLMSATLHYMSTILCGPQPYIQYTPFHYTIQITHLLLVNNVRSNKFKYERIYMDLFKGKLA